jgi:hypothetical protein
MNFRKGSVMSVFFLFAGLLIICASATKAATLTVDDDRVQCPSAAFTTIQSAVNAASPGDKVNVCPGTYREQVKVNKPLTIRGIEVANQHLSLIVPGPVAANSLSLVSGNPIAAIILVDGTEGVTLTHLTVDGSNSGLTDCSVNLIGIYYRNASGTVNDMAVRNIQVNPTSAGCQGSLGVFVQSGGGHGTSRVDILDSSIHDYQKGGIVANEPGTDVNITGNHVSGGGPQPLVAQNGIQIAFGAKGVIDHNSVANHIYSQCTALSCDFFSTNILVLNSDGVRVKGNTTTNAQVSIYYGGNRGEISGNAIFQSPVFDGIDLVGDRNHAEGNNIKNSTSSGVYVLGNRNEVSGNIINEAPVGILQDSPSSNNDFAPNDFDNTGVNILPAPGFAAATLQNLTAIASGRSASAAKP